MQTHAHEQLRIYAHMPVSSAFSVSDTMLRPVSFSLVACSCQVRHGPRFVIVCVIKLLRRNRPTEEKKIFFSQP